MRDQRDRIHRIQGSLAAIAIVASGAILAIALHFARDEALRTGRNSTQSLAKLLAEQSARTLQTVDQRLQIAAIRLERLGPISAINEAGARQVLQSEVKTLPFVRAMWVLDRSGRIIYDSDVGNIGVSLADREYFRVYLERPDTQFFLSSPVRSRSIGTWLISGAYPMPGPGPRPIGVIAAALEPPYFDRLWRDLDVERHGFIALYRRDGVLLASTQGSPTAIGDRESDPQIRAVIAGKIGGQPSAIRNNGRIIGSQILSAYPQAIVVVSRAENELLAPWWRWCMVAIAIWLASSAVVVALLLRLRGMMRQRSSALEALRASERKFSAAFKFSPDAILLASAKEGRVVDVSDSVTRLSGYSREELLGQRTVDLGLWARPSERDEYVRQLSKNGHVRDLEAAFRVKTGELRIGLVSGELVDVGGEAHIMGVIRDITESKRKEQLIWHQANFDMLTGLPNRHMFASSLEQYIVRARENSGGFSLFLVDLDQFKEVNDALGHEKGDALLVQVAARIAGCIPPSAQLARLGGDEFTVLLEDDGQLDAVLKKIIDGLSAPFDIGLERVYISASIGVARFPQAGERAEELLQHVDQAMYAAKKAGRNRYCHFHPALEEAALARARLTSDLRTALEHHELTLHYQPIVDMRTGRLRKAEALLRWQHPVRGAVNPAEFIPLAESSGLILDIGDWVFHEAARQVRRMRVAGHADFDISVNVSPIQFHNDTGLAGRWINRLRELELPASSVSIEITESLLLEMTAEVKAALGAFSRAGIQVVLDDFGTGYSSLSYLNKFDIDYLKIDRAFVSTIETNPDDLALCEAIIVMAHRLGLLVVVEGVETSRQDELLRAAGCDYGQGFFYHRPMTADQLESYVDATTRTTL